MPGETVRGRQENRSTSIIKTGDRERERWCLLLINVWSDIKEGTVNLTVKLANLRGMTIIWLRYAGNNWISHVALYAVGVPKPVHGPHRALRVVKRAVRAPIYSGQCHHQAFLPTYNHPVAVSLTYRISGWEPVAHFLIHSRPHWLALPAGWVARLPGSHLHAKCVFICFPVLVLWKWKQLHFNNWEHGRVTQPLSKVFRNLTKAAMF